MWLDQRAACTCNGTCALPLPHCLEMFYLVYHFFFHHITICDVTIQWWYTCLWTCLFVFCFLMQAHEGVADLCLFVSVCFGLHMCQPFKAKAKGPPPPKKETAVGPFPSLFSNCRIHVSPSSWRWHLGCRLLVKLTIFHPIKAQSHHRLTYSVRVACSVLKTAFLIQMFSSCS